MFCSILGLWVIQLPELEKPKCPLTEERIETMWYIYTVEYYSAVKKNSIREFSGKLMELEIIILNVVTQIQKDKHGMYS